MTNAAKTLFSDKPIHSKLDLIRLSREGLSMEALDKVLAFTALSRKDITTMLPVSERQLLRYPKTHVLRKDISSHLIQLVELYERGYEAFGKEKFNTWMRSENRVLDDVRPIDLLDTTLGMQMIGDLIGRIEHGIYS